MDAKPVTSSPLRLFTSSSANLCVLLLLSLAALLAATAARAQPVADDATSGYFHTLWTTDNGLPQNSIQDILQTGDGYLWLTTLDGLVRYNGAQFTVFNRANSPGIISNRFTALFEDAEGSLWIGAYDGCLRYQDGSFTPYTTSDGLAANWVWAIYADRDGKPLFLTERGVSKWTGARFRPYLPTGGGTAGAYAYEMRRGGLAFFNANFNANKDAGEMVNAGVNGEMNNVASGLYVRDDAGFRIYTERDGLASRNLTSLYEDGAGALWVAAREGHLYKVKDGSVRDYGAVLKTASRAITAVCEDRAGNVWVADAEGGLRRLAAQGRGSVVAVEALVGKRVEKMIEDREGVIWVGTYNDGLYRLSRQTIAVYAAADGLALDNVYPIYEDRQGDIWVGTWGGGLNRFRGGSFNRQSATLYTTKEGLAHNYVSAIGEDAQGNLWVGTRGGLNCLKDGRIIARYDRRDGLPDNSVQAILCDRAGALWIGTNEGLGRFADGVFKTYAQAEGLTTLAVRAICEDRAGALWLGTTGGLYRFQNGAFTAYGESAGLSSNPVRAIYEDAEGVLWVGTYDGGLNRLQGGKITGYTAQNGLFDNGVFQILEDGAGNFWMSCNRGIYRVSRQQLNDYAEGKVASVVSVAYGKSDGLRNIECNGDRQPAGIKTRDGRLLFPTQAGIAVITPQVLTEAWGNSQAPPVVIEDCLLDRQSVSRQRVNAGGGVEIRPTQQNLEIHYAGLSFLKPEHVRFKYRLDGVDEDWVDAGTRRIAYYSRLPSGAHTFRVIAANSDGVWNLEGASLRILVIPPFYQTWWFRLLLLAALAALALLFYRKRIAALQRKHAAQEAFSRQLLASQEQERQRIAAELHDGLGQSLVIIKNWSLLGLRQTAARHPARPQLEEISQTAARALDEVREIAHNLRPYELDRLGLSETLREMCERAASASGICFSTELALLDGCLSKEAEITLYRIAQEAVNNIVKHSQATAARLVMQRVAGVLQMTIADNGKGMAPTPTASPASEFSESSASAEARAWRGFGLTGMAERARLLGGSLTLTSSAAAGTTINIQIHLREKTDERGEAS